MFKRHVSEHLTWALVDTWTDVLNQRVENLLRGHVLEHTVTHSWRGKALTSATHMWGITAKNHTNVK